ncbi:glycosyltransferase [Reinekea sp.]|jgi:glycosyltransferase involved in cell wall biosynthesis|uniref:glycosyltransferase n=1 Tax=Reinekea sp. TaxID=1970455 RepID=UPI003988B14F
MTSVKQKPTILHVIDTTGPGGAETVFLDLAEKMHIEGHQNLALIKGPGWVQNQLQARSIPFQVIKPYGFLSLPYYLKLAKLLKHENVVYVQAHLLGSALTFAILSLVTGTPVVATLHGQVDVNPNERFIGTKRWLLKKGLRKVIAVSGQLADYLANRNLFSRQQLSVIHNGINVARYNVEDSGQLRKQYGWPKEAILVGSIGNIRPAKDYQNLIKAAALVVAENPNTHFLIAGHSKKPLQTELDELVTKLNLEKHIHFLGFLDNTPEFLAQLDVFTLSSKEEGFSISTLEAMAAKLPIVVTQCGGPEEIIEPNVDGLMVEVGSPEQLATAILNAAKDSEARVNKAFQKVETQFNEQVLIKKYSAICVSTI